MKPDKIFEVTLTNEYGSRLVVCIEAETYQEALNEAKRRYKKVWPIVEKCSCTKIKG